jgi:hypothetical protein
VCEQYRGLEVSDAARDARKVNRVECLRRALTVAQRLQFVRYADQYCRDAYAVKAEWFAKCLKARNGREQLRIWIGHWLSGWVAENSQGRMIEPLDCDCLLAGRYHFRPYGYKGNRRECYLGMSAFNTPQGHDRLVSEWNKRDHGTRVWSWEPVLRGDVDDPAKDRR